MMTDPIKAIETRYNGHRFRSRTEARWAVLFDHLGVKYEYEPEGYEFGDGARYLPDFYLPNEGFFLEIKGKAPTLSEIHKAGMLAFHTGKYVDLLIGAPWDYDMVAIRGRRQLDDMTMAFLESAPEQGMCEWLKTVLRITDFYVPDALGERAPAEWVYLNSSLRPYYVTGLRRYGFKDEHLELDFDQMVGRLALWKASLHVSSGSEVVDERYSLYALKSDYAETFIWRMVLGPDSREAVENTEEITPSPKWRSAVAAARSARFEFGESGAG